MRNVLGVLFTPVKTMKHLADARPLLPAAAVWCLGGLSWWYGLRWAEYWGAKTYLPPLHSACPVLRGVGHLLLDPNPVVLLVLGPVVFLAAWLLRTAVLHLAAELLGGEGRVLSLLATLGHALSPLWLAAPLSLVCGALGKWTLDVGWPGTVWQLVSAALYLWCLILVVLAIREAHRFTTRQAVLTIVAVAAAAAVVVLVVWAGFTVSGTRWGDLAVPL